MNKQQEKLCDVDSCTGDHDEALNTNKYNAACSCGCIKGQLIQSLEAQITDADGKPIFVGDIIEQNGSGLKEVDCI